MSLNDQPCDSERVLQQLEHDYVKAIDDNQSTTVEHFIEQFLYDSWTYNDQHLADIQLVLRHYSGQTMDPGTFNRSFQYMVQCLQTKLEHLDQTREYPMLHTSYGASLLVATVDGLIVQYYASIYNVDQLRAMTPGLTTVVLQSLKIEIV